MASRVDTETLRRSVGISNMVLLLAQLQPLQYTARAVPLFRSSKEAGSVCSVQSNQEHAQQEQSRRSESFIGRIKTAVVLTVPPPHLACSARERTRFWPCVCVVVEPLLFMKHFSFGCF